ncbi:RICIN domain-containing protein [Streptomyces cremeus]|uniref:RICIN domain-containing protein n=1 Tax=Streptomyces cremeus TaxID=66881 RepID=A0ABV5PJG5_STRCM
MSTAQTEAGDGSFDPGVSTVAGTGVAGSTGDGEAAVTAQLNLPYGVAVDRDGTLYISESSGHRVRKVTPDGKIATVAGTGVAGRGGSGDRAVAAQLNLPRGVAVDGAGNLYIADQVNHRVRKVTADGKIATVAGTGTAGFTPDGRLATEALLNGPFGLAVDSTGTLYIAEYTGHRVRKVTADGKIATVAGTGTEGFTPDGRLATETLLNRPFGVAVDSTGTVYIADSFNHRVRKVTADGKIATVAGTGAPAFGGDGEPAASAQLHFPGQMVVDSTDTLYICDHKNHRIRRITADGKISTVAGTGTASFEDGPASSAKLHTPAGLAMDCVGTLYIADSANHRVRKVASAKMAGLPESGTVVSWANVRSGLRMGVWRESTKDGAEVHQSLSSPRAHQRWRLIVAGEDEGEVVYRVENLRSGKVLEVVGGGTVEGAVVAQRAYEGSGAGHQQWRLIPVGSAADAPRVYELANRNSGLLLRVGTNAPTVIKQYGAQGDHRDRQWQLLPV